MTMVVMLAALVLGTSCEHKPLWEKENRHEMGYDRHVVLKFDWSQLETPSDMPKTIKVVFHDPETDEVIDLNFPAEMEGQDIVIPSGVKHLYIYNTDETDFAGHIDPSDWHKNYLYMLPSYRGLKKVYLFSEDVTVLPPEIDKELEPQIVKVTPTCRTTHFDVTVNNPNSKNNKGDIVTWAVAFVDMYPYYAEDYSTVDVKQPVNIRYPLIWDNTANTLYGSLKTFNFQKQNSTLAKYMLYVSSSDILTDQTYYRFDITDQVKAQEGAHIYHFTVDLTGKIPVPENEAPKFE